MEESKSESWMVNEHLLYFDFEDVQNAWRNPNTKNLYISEDNACEVRQTELLVCSAVVGTKSSVISACTRVNVAANCQ